MLIRALPVISLPSPAHNLPAISVVIPAYDCADTILKAAQSVLSQTYGGAIEVIIVNDGSPDTVALEEALRPIRERILYLKQRNRGVSLARNAGILAASGDWIAFLDSDDFWYPNALDVLLGTAGESWEVVYGNGDMVGPLCSPGERYRDWSPSSGPVTPEALLSGRCCVLTSSVLAKRRALIEAGLFDPSIHHSEDLDLWVKIALNGTPITYTDAPLMCKVTRTGSQSEDRTKMALGVMEVCERVMVRKDASEEVRATARERLAHSKRYYWKYKIKQSPSLAFLTKNSAWCYFRHIKIDGYCATCDRSWNLKTR